MNCTALAALAHSQMPVGGTAAAEQAAGSTLDCSRSARFAELMSNQYQPPAQYVEPKPVPHRDNPVIDAMSELQALPVSHAQTIAPAQSRDVVPANMPEAEVAPSTPADEYQSIFDQALSAQQQLVRTSMMMEVMSTAKQGVTTLFQQQG